MEGTHCILHCMFLNGQYFLLSYKPLFLYELRGGKIVNLIITLKTAADRSGLVLC